jgi:superfamily II DNA or RNA helicase
MDAAKILTHKGYSIRKDVVTADKVKRLMEDLTVCPALNTKFATAQQKADATFKIYRESPTRWYLPRHYGIETFGQPDSSVLSDGQALRDTIVFGGTPYPYQTDIIDSFINAGANGLICVPCGKGKTFMALSIAARLRRRFLVVVDKEFLMNQWRGEMEALMPGIRIGIIQEDRKEIGFVEEVQKEPTIPELKARLRELGLRVGGTKEQLVARLKEAEPPAAPVERVQYDCAIALIQTVVRREFSPTDFEGFGFTIFDECHHLGAQSFSRVLQRIQTKYMLGLSATPTREDGLTKVFFWFLGKPVYWEKTREPDPTVEVKSVMIRTDDVTYNTIPTNWRGEPVTAQLLTNVLGCAERTDEIVRWVLRLAEEPARKILVLSERIGHLEEIERLIVASEKGLTIAYYIGGMKEKVREEGAATARILLASYAMASEAMNIKSLNSVVLASPRKHVEQSTGRILRVRQSERVVVPVIVDIVDSHMMYIGQWKKRKAYYKQCAYKLESWSMGVTERVIKEPVVTVPNGCLIED